MHFTVYGTLLSQGPLTALYNFDSGSAFYNLIVGPHRVTLNLYGFISDFLKEPFASERAAVRKQPDTVNRKLSYRSSLTIRAENNSLGVHTIQPFRLSFSPYRGFLQS